MTDHDFEGLGSRLSGDVVSPGGDGWDLARQAWNLHADQHPAAVVFAESAEDVQATVRFARESGLRVAPQGTGHGAMSLDDLSRSVLLKTTRMSGVEVADGRARAAAGVLAEDVANAAGAAGKAALTGSSPNIGFVGYSLGGGMGWLGRKYGFQCNAVRSAELVNAEGELVRVDAETEPDLFWALRGGGGSFGVVTALEFDLVDHSEAYAGMLVWDWEQSEAVMRRWAEWAAEAPEEVTTSARILQFPPIPDVPEPFRGRQLCIVDGAFVGSADQGEELLAPLRELGPEMDMWQTMPSQGLIRIHGDPEEPVPYVSDTRNVGELPQEAIDAFVAAAGPGSGSQLLMAELRQLGGAMSRPPEDGGGALSHLDDPYVLFGVAMAMTPEMAAAGEASAKAVCEAMGEWATSRCYFNFAEQPGPSEELYGPEDYERLKRIRATADPDGLFQSNHPIG